MEMFATYEQNITWTYNMLRFKAPMPTYHENMWLGIGYKTTTSDSADLVQCKWYQDNAYCTDHWNNRFPGTPEDDTQDDIYIYHADWQYNGYFDVGWKRKFNTTDGENDVVIPYDEDMSMIWAYGQVDSTTGEILIHEGYGVSMIHSPVVPGAAALTSIYLAVLAFICL